MRVHATDQATHEPGAGCASQLPTQDPNRDALVQYARFIGDTRRPVLNQLIDSMLRRDRDFLA